jgi:glycosyltransferase involved in cell wall biosynthesis
VNAHRASRPYRGIQDGVIVQTIAGGYTVAAWRIARRLGLKFIYRMSCDADIDGRLVGAAPSKDYFSALRDADGIIAQSEYQQQRLADELGVASTVVPSIVEIPDVRAEGRGSYALWVGRAAPIKRPWIMIETARLLPDIDFVMVMPKEADIFWMSVMQEAARVRNLLIVPGAPYFEMGEYYRDAALLVGTSAVEGFPNVFLQAAAYGKPIVSLDNDPAGMLGVHGAGHCVQGDIERLRQTIVELMGDSTERARLGLKARDYVSVTHSPQAVTPLLVEFLRDLTGQ